MILIDTNILIDIAFADAEWSVASKRAFVEASVTGPVACVDVVFAELATGFLDAAAVREFLEGLAVSRSVMTDKALWLAGQAFATYRRRGGTKTNVLADFFIGAQALSLRVPLLTRDEGRYRTYFPDVRLITP